MSIMIYYSILYSIIYYIIARSHFGSSRCVSAMVFIPSLAWPGPGVVWLTATRYIIL